MGKYPGGKATRKPSRKLQETYGVRLWSEQERAKLVYDTPELGKRKDRKS
ncbi:hypothetical protein [Nitrospira sp. BLG_2]